MDIFLLSWTAWLDSRWGILWRVSLGMYVLISGSTALSLCQGLCHVKPHFYCHCDTGGLFPNSILIVWNHHHITHETGVKEQN